MKTNCGPLYFFRFFIIPDVISKSGCFFGAEVKFQNFKPVHLLYIFCRLSLRLSVNKAQNRNTELTGSSVKCGETLIEMSCYSCIIIGFNVLIMALKSSGQFGAHSCAPHL